MNWLDIVILVILALGLYQGMKLGLIGAAITVTGVFIGWLLAGQLADDIGNVFEDSLSNDTLITVVSYVVIIAASLIGAKISVRIIKPILVIGTVGLAELADKIGGIVLGLIMGATVAGVVITGMARFAYNFTLPAPGVALPVVQEKKEFVENALVGSAIVPAFLDVKSASPDNVFGLIPSDFRASLDILESEIDTRTTP